MVLSPFHAYVKARQISCYAFGKDKLIPVFASSDIQIYPYQIAAAQFALRSPYLKGVVLCDEGSLGKTYEAMLVVTQRWYEGKERILIIVPTPLLHQWSEVIQNRFTLPFFTIDSNTVWDAYIAEGVQNPFMQEGILLTTYEFAVEKACVLETILWDLAVCEEAGRLCTLYTGENKMASTLKKALGNAFKILLTPTPINKSILDLFGLIQFIDETVFPDMKAFYGRYFRKPENYEELAERASKYCFRTLRSQVASYVKIPKRLPVAAEFVLSNQEQQLYGLLEKYVDKREKIAFPKMDQYDLALMLFRTFSSSTFALQKTLQGIAMRLETMDFSDSKVAVEYSEIKLMLELAKGITENAKGTALKKALKTGFLELKKRGANQKAIIFTENRTTQKYLYSLLIAVESPDTVLLYSGDNTRDYSIMKRFEQEAKILIATDIAAEGFNLEFCSFVINYDIPYNTLMMEQRINRCHRQGQQNDVIILNFFDKNNFADVRMLELINKRTLQFSGIFGMSDNVIGNFGVDFSKILDAARTTMEIEQAHQKTLEQFEDTNRELIHRAEDSLFTSFSKEIADNVVITPQYIKDKTEEINNDLWEVTKYFFEQKRDFEIMEDSRTISCFGNPPKVFTGVKMGRNEYSMEKDYQPRSGRHTITGALAKNILEEIFWKGVPESGTITVEGATPQCTIGYYQIRVLPKNEFWNGYSFYTFVGMTAKGKILNNEACRRIMELPVLSFSATGQFYGDSNRNAKLESPHVLDSQILPKQYIDKVFQDTNSAQQEEINRLKRQFSDQKLSIERDLEHLRFEVKTAQSSMGKDIARIEKLKAQKKLNAMLNELQQGEEALFINKMKLDLALEKQIKELCEQAQLTATVNREFILKIGGKQNE